MKFIADFLGIGPPGTFTGAQVRNPGKAAYKSPTGNLVPFDFTDVDSAIATKAAVFESAGGDGTYIQPNGHTSGRFPMAAIFHGDGYEPKAEAFLAALLEPGVGQLTHPAYSVPINVVPVGEITRRDAFVSGANQVTIEVSFYETTGLQLGGDVGLDQLFDQFNDASAVDFRDKTQLDSVADKASFVNKVKNVVKNISAGMKVASQGLTGATQRIEGVGDSIDRGIDLLVGQPLSLARQTQILIGEPRRQANGAKAKLQGYSDLAADIFGGTAVTVSDYSNDPLNNFHMDNMSASSIVANYAMLSDEATEEFTTKADYIKAAEDLAQLLEDYQTWRDDSYTIVAGVDISESDIDTGGGMMELRRIVGIVLSDLIIRSFAAKTEIREPLKSDRTPVDLCYELYGTTDFDTMDLFLYSNQIHGEEHFLIQKGREIVRFV